MVRETKIVSVTVDRTGYIVDSDPEEICAEKGCCFAEWKGDDMEYPDHPIIILPPGTYTCKIKDDRGALKIIDVDHHPKARIICEGNCTRVYTPQGWICI
jgi:hypothetical protein